MQFKPVEKDGKKLPSIVNLNSENRVLPFPTYGCVKDIPVKTEVTKTGLVKTKALKFFLEKCILLASKQTIQCVTIDSLTRLLNKILKNENDMFTGKDKRQMWGEFGFQVQALLEEYIPMLNDKYVIVTAHEEAGREDEPSKEMRVPVGGKTKAVGIESYFDIVLWTVINPDGNAKDGTKYLFQTCTNADNRAKTPPGMYDEEEEMFVPNDVSLVLDRYIEMFGSESRPKILIAGRSGSGKSYSLRNLVYKGE
jgi:hypothetical protein